MLWIVLHIALLTSVTLSEIYPYDEETQTTMEDNRFTIIKFMDGLFLYAEESVSHLAKSLTTVVLHFDTSVQFIIDSFSTIIDILIRQPANLVNFILYAVSWTIDSLVYLVLDVIYHYLIKGTFLWAKWIFIQVLIFVTNLIYYILYTLVYLSKTIVLTYVNIFTFIFVYLVTPLFQSVFWTLSFVIVSFFMLWGVFESWDRFKMATEGGNNNVVFFALLLLPVSCILFIIWFRFCSFIFSFIFYPLMILVYCSIVGLLTYHLALEIFERCQQYVLAFDKEALLNRLDTVLRELAGPQNNIVEIGVRQAGQVDDSVYTDMECIVCFEVVPLVKLFPCKHKIMCYNCTIRILENDYRCPICRGTIRYYGNHDF